MAQVTGFIGNEEVELNNAATEATLKLLLSSTMAANKQTLDQLKALATNAGLNAESFDETDTRVRNLGIQSSILSRNIFWRFSQ